MNETLNGHCNVIEQKKITTIMWRINFWEIEEIKELILAVGQITIDETKEKNLGMKSVAQNM